MNVIEVQNASYEYKTYNDDGTTGTLVAVDDVSFEIKKGSFVALVGHNGSGKSTLAKMLNGLHKPKKGQVLVNGLSTAVQSNIFEIRKNVGMVFQNPDNQMVASIVEEDVAFGPENLAIPQPEIVQRVAWALEQVNMSQYAKRSPHKLSGGQKQRIAIAGALAIKPQVLVLDESTAMLDPQGRKEVLAVAKKLNADGMTVVLITHFMEEVLDADNVIVMKRGKIVAQGTPMEIFSQQSLVEDAFLRVPRTVELAQRLSQAGWSVDASCTDAKALGGQLCQLLQKN
ncbi:MAG: energy-coupling factor transporter ATPase [Clostridia bacterium]|nr:energy-coupling factor transporter ATPase [Clostridia bacterium]